MDTQAVCISNNNERNKSVTVAAAAVTRYPPPTPPLTIFITSLIARGKVRKFDHPEADVVRCLLPLHTSELGRLTVPEEERERDTVEDGGAGDTRSVEEALEEYTKFMDDHGIPEKVRMPESAP